MVTIETKRMEEDGKPLSVEIDSKCLDTEMFYPVTGRMRKNNVLNKTYLSKKEMDDFFAEIK